MAALATQNISRQRGRLASMLIGFIPASFRMRLLSLSLSKGAGLLVEPCCRIYLDFLNAVLHAATGKGRLCIRSHNSQRGSVFNPLKADTNLGFTTWDVCNMASGTSQCRRKQAQVKCMAKSSDHHLTIGISRPWQQTSS